MTLICADSIGSRSSLASLLHNNGRIALSFDVGSERDALMAGTMIGDIFRQRVRYADTPGAETLLHVHVGQCPSAPDVAAPLLIIRTSDMAYDTVVQLDVAPWNICPLVRIPALGWAGSPLGTTVIASDHGPVCTRSATAWVLHANLPAVYGREALRHATADADVPAILACHLVMRAVLSQIVALPEDGDRALSLITVDAEDQQRYFINRAGHCSNIRGAPDGDLQFANSCRTIMTRCEAAGLKAIFMVTGDELDPSFVDAFGDKLIGLEDNRRVLGEMTSRGHDVACHGYDHEWWISKGTSAITPMTFLQKLRYFFETSGDLRTLLGLTKFLIANAPQLLHARAATHARTGTLGEPFTYAEIQSDLERWMALVEFQGDRLFIRYPGYVRSAATVSYLDDRYAATVDSSDLYQLDDGLPAFPYSLLAERNGVLLRTRIIEIPCLWIDKLLRTRDAVKVEAQLAQLARLARVPGSVLSFITHTKVLGATWGHCHVYLHDPLKGMALPASQEAWRAFAAFLRHRTRSGNWRDLQLQVLEVAA